jgi:DNA-binding IclR family transcriptional regulator
VREGKHALFIDHHATVNHIVAVVGQTGELVPLYCTAHGKALLADFTRTDLEALFGTKSVRAYTKRTIVSLHELADACAEIKARGFASDDEEFYEGIRCVAAPIRDKDGVVIGSIGISAPVARFSKEREPVCAAQVLEIANQISGMLNPGAGRIAKPGARVSRAADRRSPL